MTLEARKLRLIRRIADSETEETLAAVERALEPADRPSIRTLDLSKTGLKESIDLDEVRRQRPPKPINWEEWKHEVDQLEWTESIDDLLKQLKE